MTPREASGKNSGKRRPSDLSSSDETSVSNRRNSKRVSLEFGGSSFSVSLSEAGSDESPSPASKTTGNRFPIESVKKIALGSLTKFQIKQKEREAARELKTRRELMMDVLGSQILSSLFSLGDFSRDVIRSCCLTFGWNMSDWKDILKEGKVWIYEPLSKRQPPASEHSKKPNHKKLQTGRAVWPVDVEVKGLSLLIMKSGGTRVQMKARSELESNGSSEKDSINWGKIEHHSELRCVFVHRSSIETFLSLQHPSVIELTTAAPRTQLFAFGHPPTSPACESEHASVELIFKGGAIILPTFDALFKKPSLACSMHLPYFKQLAHFSHIHPFIRIFLLPSVHQRILRLLSPTGVDSHLYIDLLIKFVTEMRFNDPSLDSEESLAELVQKPRYSMDYIEHPDIQMSDEIDDEISEIRVLNGLATSIRMAVFKEFRRFIIAVSDRQCLKDCSIAEGIEYIEVETLCQMLKEETF